jgi:hypothetical protein
MGQFDRVLRQPSDLTSSELSLPKHGLAASSQMLIIVLPVIVVT